MFRIKKKFSSNWSNRIGELFNCGVVFENRSILDIGCNMGIIAYEIGKHNPSSYHGIDTYRKHISICKAIFQGFDFPSQWDSTDLSKDNGFTKLNSSYDIVLFLSVYQHIAKKKGEESADRVVQRLAERCSSTFIIRTSDEYRKRVIAVLNKSGFTETFRSDAGEIGGISVLSKK